MARAPLVGGIVRPERSRQEPIGFRIVEAKQVEIERLLLQRRQFGREHLVVSTPVDRDLVHPRLTWEGLKGHSAEAYAHVDSPINVFAKVHIGGGMTSGGRINDEDWASMPRGCGQPGYSNTDGSASGFDLLCHRRPRL